MREVCELFDVDWYDCEKSELVELAKFFDCLRYDPYGGLDAGESLFEVYTVAEERFGTEFCKRIDDATCVYYKSKLGRGSRRFRDPDSLSWKTPFRIRKDGKVFKSDLEKRKRELKTKYLT